VKAVAWRHDRDMADEVTLRPVLDEDDLSSIETLSGTELGGEYVWFGWQPRTDRRERLANGTMINSERGTLLVVRGTERLGFVSWHRRQIYRESYCWNIGIGLFPEARGKGYGTQAQRLLVRYLFAHSPLHRIEADTELANIAEQRSLEKAGFQREGVVRGSTWRDGAWRDGVMYGILRTDPQA
jgi:RimJ/RimL family protein N-acetyltransferase